MTYKNEKNVMPQKDLRKLQLIQLEMLLEVDRICRENDIRYILASGSLLGAIRHEGFIPWDDDLDIRMKREDFEKFFEVCKRDLNTERFFLQTYKTDEEYRWGYAKLRRKGTEYIRKGQEAINCFSGVSIDIFVFDNLPQSKFGKLLYHYIRRACIKTLWSVIGATEERNLIKRQLYRGLRHVDKRIPLTILEMLAKYSNRKETGCTCCLSFYRWEKYNNRISLQRIMNGGADVKWLTERVEVMFEEFSVYIPKDYEEYLSRSYTNWWEFPPMEQRYIHPPLRYNLDVDINLRGRDIEYYMNKEYKFITKEDYYKNKKEN